MITFLSHFYNHHQHLTRKINLNVNHHQNWMNHHLNYFNFTITYFSILFTFIISIYSILNSFIIVSFWDKVIYLTKFIWFVLLLSRIVYIFDIASYSINPLLYILFILCLKLVLIICYLWILNQTHSFICFTIHYFIFYLITPQTHLLFVILYIILCFLVISTYLFFYQFYIFCIKDFNWLFVNIKMIKTIFNIPIENQFHLIINKNIKIYKYLKFKT